MKFDNLIMKKLDLIEDKLDKQLLLLEKLTVRQETLEETIKEISANANDKSKIVKVVESISSITKNGKIKNTKTKKNKVEEDVK